MTIIVTCIYCGGYVEADDLDALDRLEWEITKGDPTLRSSTLMGLCPDSPGCWRDDAVAPGGDLEKEAFMREHGIGPEEMTQHLGPAGEGKVGT